MRRGISSVLALAALLLGLSSRAMAQAENYTLSVSVQHSTFYPAGRWVPLRIEARNDTDREVDGYVSLPVSPNRAEMELRLPMRLPAKSRVKRTALAIFPEENVGTPSQRRSGEVPPVTVAELRSGDGARLAQQPLLATPLVPAETISYGIIAPPATTLMLADQYPEEEPFDADIFLDETLQRLGGYASALAGQDQTTFPRHPAVLDGVRVILVLGFDPDRLDPAQRRTMLDFIERGGYLIVCSPDPAVVETSWLAPHLPVQLIGRRLMDRIEATDGKTWPLRGYVPVAEALPGSGEVLLQDEHYVHVAQRPIGMGRLIFTSFPINALQRSDAADALWLQLLRNTALPREWEDTGLVAARDSILSRMIGKRVAPWGLAAGVTGAYLLGVVGVQLLLNGPRRPGAFAITLGIAGALSAALVAMGVTRQADQTPMAARIATLDVGAEGGGTMREAAAFVGVDDPEFGLSGQDDAVSLKLMESFGRGDRPVVWQQPFNVPAAGMRAESYQRVWTARGRLPAEVKLGAVARFDEQGLTVRIDNGSGGPLVAPSIVWGPAVLPAGARAAEGQTQARAAATAGASVIVSGEDKLRSDVLDAMLAPASQVTNVQVETAPTLVGFLEDANVPRLLRPSRDDLTMRTVALARTPLQIQPSPVGDRVRIPGEVMAVDPGPTRGLPYDASRQEWLQSSMDGTWLIGFRPPAQVGQLRPIRLLVDANLNAPRHRLTLYRQQVRNGRPEVNLAAEPAVQWDTPAGARDAVIEVDASDADATGTIWLRLQVERAGGIDTSGLPAPWQVHWLRAAYEAEVIGPPQGTAAIASTTSQLEADHQE